MSHKRIGYVSTSLIIVLVLVIVTGCNTTRHLKDGQYLLRSNSVKLESDEDLSHKTELKDNLSGLIVQKPNTRWFGIIPFKLWLYNRRLDKRQADTVTGKSVEPPVIYDSTTLRKTVQNMKSYMFYQGYFYAQVRDTTRLTDDKAHVTYQIKSGINYLINDVTYDVDDKAVLELINANVESSALERNIEFSYNLLDEERLRLTTLLRNNGYYYISNDNISFVLDTLNKQYLEDIENPFESALNFISLQDDEKKPTLDIKTVVRRGNEPKAYIRYGIGDVRVYPDFRGVSDIRDTTMIVKQIDGSTFRYHDYYIHENVLYNHILLKTGKYFKQSHYDQTISRLNELGIFQSVRMFIREDTTDKSSPILDVAILLTPADKFDLSPSIEVSTGSIYKAGSGVNLSFRNRNVGKGGNLLTISTNASVEYQIDSSGFYLLNRRLGGNMSLDFPKFLIPGGRRLTAHYSNVPRTLFSTGVNMLDRVRYFTLINTSFGFTYKWNETETKSWEVTPAFINLIKVPRITDEFQTLLDSSAFLRNTYRNTFIEGQTVTFTYNNRKKTDGSDYSYLSVSLEEAGGLLNGIKSVFGDTGTQFSQYVKLDADLQHFFRNIHNTIALRLYTGIGMPYGHSVTLPYIKQYFAGGPYSIRGWQLRRLGPGGSAPPTSTEFADRTGDIKLEFNAEYRFDIIKIFGGTTQLNGAVFTDAGNIWLYNKSNEYVEGQFHLKNLWPTTAVSSGVGLRMDIASLIVLRFDLAVRMKAPYGPYGGWLVGTSNWPFKNNNLNPNIAIGYPF